MTTTATTAGQAWKSVAASARANRTVNPIRQLVDCMDLAGNPSKAMIPLSIGDPTVFGNMRTPDVAVEAVVATIRGHKHDGYPHSAGYVATREAIAAHNCEELAQYTAEDVVVTSGCSGALEIAIGVLHQPRGNILIPEPGFSLYKTIAVSLGMETRGYPLKADCDWEIDLEAVENTVDDNTVAIVINNPSNPCGSSYSQAHLLALLDVAARRQVLVISDEVYAYMVFEGQDFFPLASLSSKVPVLTVGGIGKRYLVPGWRLGWILIHDPVAALTEHIRPGLIKMTQHILGANSLVQAALPTILAQTPSDFFSSVMRHLQESATVVFEGLRYVPGLTPVMPRGALYIMVGIDPTHFRDIANDVDFVQKLLKEQSVFCLPASIFDSPNFIRIVTSVPKSKIVEAVDRICEFARNHSLVRHTA